MPKHKYTQAKRKQEEEKEGMTPLHLAVIHNDLNAIKALVKSGIDLNQYDYYGRLPIEYAEEKSHIKAFLLKQGALLPSFFSPLHEASSLGDLKEVKKLLKEDKKSVYVLDNYGRAPLRSAVRNEHIEVVKMLVRNGADINRIDRAGFPPIAFQKIALFKNIC